MFRATTSKFAFAACEWLIAEIKRTVPIWKKEFYADGSAWAEADDENLKKSRSAASETQKPDGSAPRRNLL